MSTIDHLLKHTGHGIENVRLHTCVCGWYRNLATMFEGQFMDHPVYGIVTWGRAAELDIKHHDCTNTEISRRVVKGTLRHAA